MNVRVGIILCALFLAASPLRAAASASYDAKSAPLDDLCRDLLTSNGYELHDDGQVWDKINEAAVARDEMPYLLSRLASARRLKALLQLNGIITRYDAERKLTAEDKDAVRDIARKNWVFFGVTPRRDFRSYFSVQELETLDKIAPRFDSMAPVTLTDPEPLTAQPPVTAPAPVISSTTAAPKPELGILKPWTPPPASTTTIAVALSTIAAVVAVSTPVSVAPVDVAPAPPEPAKPISVDAAQYEKFIQEGPYSKESKALLELIGKRAPDYCLPLLRRTVTRAVPQLVFDGARTGPALRASFSLSTGDALAPPVVALSPGPVLISVKKGLLSARHDVVLPEAPEAWTELGLRRPPLDAWRTDAGSVVENGDWGSVKVFLDGSRRGSYSDLEQAGELLEQLLRLGLAREGYTQSPYATRRWARTARLLFSARLKTEMKRDNFLDPDRRAELRDWLDGPEELDDVVFAAWAGSRLQILDPRRGPPDAERQSELSRRASCLRTALEDALAEAGRKRAARVSALEILLDAGVADAAEVKAAAQAAADAKASADRALAASMPACPALDPALDAGLRRAALLIAEAARAERALRESRTGLEGHGL